MLKQFVLFIFFLASLFFSSVAISASEASELSTSSVVDTQEQVPLVAFTFTKGQGIIGLLKGVSRHPEPNVNALERKSNGKGKPKLPKNRLKSKVIGKHVARFDLDIPEEDIRAVKMHLSIFAAITLLHSDFFTRLVTSDVFQGLTTEKFGDEFLRRVLGSEVDRPWNSFKAIPQLNAAMITGYGEALVDVLGWMDPAKIVKMQGYLLQEKRVQTFFDSIDVNDAIGLADEDEKLDSFLAHTNNYIWLTIFPVYRDVILHFSQIFKAPNIDENIEAKKHSLKLASIILNRLRVEVWKTRTSEEEDAEIKKFYMKKFLSQNPKSKRLNAKSRELAFQQYMLAEIGMVTQIGPKPMLTSAKQDETIAIADEKGNGSLLDKFLAPASPETPEQLVPYSKLAPIYLDFIIHCMQRIADGTFNVSKLSASFLPQIHPPLQIMCKNSGCNLNADKRCSECPDTTYCSEKCQRAHWKQHKADHNSSCYHGICTAKPKQVTL